MKKVIIPFIIIIIAILLLASIFAVAQVPLFSSPPPPPDIHSNESEITPPPLPRDQPPKIAPPLPSPLTINNLKRDALRELDHAYKEFHNLNDLFNYTRENDIKVDDVSDLSSLAQDLYKIALKYFEDENYIKARIYAHLAIESIHGIRDLINYKLVTTNVAIPPPSP